MAETPQAPRRARLELLVRRDDDAASFEVREIGSAVAFIRSRPQRVADSADSGASVIGRGPAQFVLTGVPAQGKMRERVAAALAGQDVPLLDESLGNRAHFASAFLEGLAVTEAAPRSAAASEVRALAAAVAALAPLPVG